MPVYQNSDQLYNCLKDVFAHIQSEVPNGIQALVDSKLVVRFRCAKPTAQITINGRMRPPKVSYGASTLLPDLDVELESDTLHLILMDTLSIKKAMAEGRMKVRGPINKTPALIDIIKAGRRFYPQLMQQKGLVT